MKRAGYLPILAILRPIGPTRVVFAKVRPYEGLGDSCAATAADRSSKTRDAVLAMALPLDAGVPLEFPMFCPIVTEPRFGHCIPSAPFTPRHCGTPNEKLPRSSQTATTTDAPSLAGAAAAPAATAPTSAVINTNSGSMNRNRNSRSSSSNTAAGATATAALTATSAAAASTAAIAPQAAPPSTARAATPSTSST